MISIDERMERARAVFLSQFGNAFEVKEVSASGGDLGDLRGMQFDSDQCGGYLHFWSSGSIEFHFVDYELGDEVLPITIRNELTEAGAEAVVSMLFGVIAKAI
jgi:hypothetical protein